MPSYSFIDDKKFKTPLLYISSTINFVRKLLFDKPLIAEEIIDHIFRPIFCVLL